MEPDTIVSYAGIPRGEAVSAAELNNAYNRILDSGLFESVEVVPQGSRLLIKVKEFPTVNRIAFEGNKRLKNEDLENIIQSQTRQVFSPTQAERDAANIAEAYVQNGRVAARVNPKIIRRSDNRVDLVFEIFEGKQISIERIAFVGNRAFSDRRLRRVVESKQAGLLRALLTGDVFIEDRLQFDRQVLTDFYNSRGYVDFRVTGVNAELARERDAYFITFNVEEGQQFEFGEITTASEIPGVEAAAYDATLKIKPGVTYSPLLVDNSIARMERLGIQQGIDFLRVEPRITRNERELKLDIEFLLSRGPRVFVERIDIKGNTTTLDRVIRRQFHMIEGDPFNPREVRQAAERMRALQFFANVDVNAREGSRPDQVVVDVEVEEASTGSVSLGLSFSSNDGVGVQTGFSERNFLGRGQALTANAAVFGDRVSYNIDFTEPAFLSRNVALGLRFSFRETDSDESFFDTRIGQFKPSLNFPISENSRLGVFYNAQYQDMSDFNGLSGILAAEVDEGDLFSSGVGYDFGYDTRRTGLNPNAGVLLSFGQEVGGLGGDLEFLRTSARIVGQTKVLREEVTLRATLEGGAQHFFNGDNSRFINRFSRPIIRGFDPNGMGPNETNGNTVEQLGGDYFAALKLEAEFPIGLPDEFGVSGGVYYDAGSIWGVDNKSNAIGTLNSTDFNLRHVVGVSVFWESPFGPLRMNFSEVLADEPGDDTQPFELTVRTDF